MYLGIDLTSSSQRPSAYAVLRGDGGLADVGMAHEDAELLELAGRWQPSVVAIDAPLSLPRGLCCLDEDCPCLAPGGLKAAERELFRRGISLYATTKRSIIKRMICRAMELRRTLEDRGFPVIEVYPYASKVSLFGRPIPKKTTSAGRTWLRKKLEGIVPGVAAYEGRLGHDELDAIVAAYSACLHARRLAEGVGDPDEGMIYLPLPSAGGAI